MSARSFSKFILSALPFLFFSCEKDPIQYTFQGSITESVNMTSLSGVNVDISQKTYQNNVASAFFINAGSATTDANGYYEISFNREKVVEIKIDLVKSGYFDEEIILASSQLTTEVPNITDKTMEPKSWVTFHIKNLGGLTTDEFTVVHYNFREGCAGCTTNEYFYYSGIVDSTFTYTTTGGKYANYSYKTPTGSTYIQDSVYTTLFDTAFVDLNY